MPKKSTRHPVPCGNCGTAMMLTDFDIGRGKKFCSKPCYDSQQNTRITKDCPVCGITFAIKRYRHLRGEGATCSRACQLAEIANRYRLDYDAADLAYFAGILDGEGCITIISSEERLRVRMYVTNCGRGLMDWLVEKFGGRVYARIADSGKTVYSWVAQEASIGPILVAARPYLKVKHEQADIAISVREHGGDAIHGWGQIARLNAYGGRVRPRQRTASK